MLYGSNFSQVADQAFSWMKELYRGRFPLGMGQPSNTNHQEQQRRPSGEVPDTVYSNSGADYEESSSDFSQPAPAAGASPEHFSSGAYLFSFLSAGGWSSKRKRDDTYGGPRCRQKKEGDCNLVDLTGDSDEEENEMESNICQLNTSNTQQQPLGIGTLVRKHFPGEGWYDGEVIGSELSRKSNRYEVSYTGRSLCEKLCEEALIDILLPCGKDPTVYDFEEFHTCWEQLEPEKIEKSSLIRQANTKISSKDTDSSTQANAQYGRLMPDATDKLFFVLRLRRSDIFLDIGHGVGNLCFQAGYCMGCEARGIEIVHDRFRVSQKFATRINLLTRAIDKRENKRRVPGPVILRRGDLSDINKHNWLVKANKVFVNNFGGVFGERMVSSEKTKWHLDHYIGGLFASLEEESILVTLFDLHLGLSQTDANQLRTLHKLPPNPSASFFEVVKVNIGLAGDVYSWSNSKTEPAFLFVYRRVKQDPNNPTATLMCCNTNCKHSRAGTIFPAVTLNDEGKVVVGTCECKVTPKTKREIREVSLVEFASPTGDFREWGRS